MIKLVDLLDLLFPAYCLHCRTVLNRGEQLLCTTCWNALPQTDYHQVRDNAMLQMLYGRVPISYAMAFCKYRSGGIVQKLIHALKYGNQPEIGLILGRYYGQVLCNLNYPFQVIIPVPLHTDKLKQRGYNQSDYFAQGLSHTLNIPWQADCLQRIKSTLSQTSQTKENRLKNLAQVFYIGNKQLIQGKHILLVDDIVTTGATLEACTTILLENGAQQVSLATIGIAA